MNATQIAERVERCLREAGRMWMYSGEPRPEAFHALLTSNKHAGGYVDVGTYLKEHPDERKEFARYLLDMIPPEWRNSLGYVVGAANSSTELAEDVANLAGVCHIRMVKVEQPEKAQIWLPDNPPLVEGRTILQVEELITTRLSAMLVREGIRRANPGIDVKFLPLLPTIVDRSDTDDPYLMVENSKVQPLLRLRIKNVDARDCIHCTAGSKAIRPKEGDNWQLLTKPVL